jgi:hypothetical protein
LNGEDGDRNAGEQRGDPAEHPGLRAVDVDDVRPLAPDQRNQLEEPEQVARGMQRAADVAKRHERRARVACRRDQRAFAVRSDHDLEARGQGRQERGDIRLRPTPRSRSRCRR